MKSPCSPCPSVFLLTALGLGAGTLALGRPLAAGSGDAPAQSAASAPLQGEVEPVRHYLPARVDIGLNMSNLAYGGGLNSGSELPFANLMKVCKTFDAVLALDSYPTGSSVVDYDQVFTNLDADGYAEEPIPFNNYVIGTHMAHGIDGHYPAGAYLVSFDGTGSLGFGGDVTGVTPLGPNQYEIQVAPTNRGLILKILASAGASTRAASCRSPI